VVETTHGRRARSLSVSSRALPYPVMERIIRPGPRVRTAAGTAGCRGRRRPQQLLVGARLADLAAVEDQMRSAVAHRRQAVRHHQRVRPFIRSRAPPGQPFGLGVERGSGLVQDQDRGFSGATARRWRGAGAPPEKRLPPLADDVCSAAEVEDEVVGEGRRAAARGPRSSTPCSRRRCWRGGVVDSTAPASRGHLVAQLLEVTSRRRPRRS